MTHRRSDMERVHRVMVSTSAALTLISYRPLFIAALCLAQKMWG